jgi:starch-binding outer membrane protein, SusD/RagB family
MNTDTIHSLETDSEMTMAPTVRAAARSGWSLRSAGRAGAVFALAGALGACDALDRLLEVEAPGVVNAEELTRPENAHLLVSGTVADFECALGAYITNAALLGNELRDASITSARFSLDARTMTETAGYGANQCTGNPPGIYVPLSVAIWTSNNALTRLEGWTDQEVANRTRHIAQSAAYGGYAHILLGEGFCSAVITELGPEVQPVTVFETAEARFARALEAAAALRSAAGAPAAQVAFADSIRNMSLIGRARTRLNLATFYPQQHAAKAQEAAADARAVLGFAPTFTRVATRSSAESRRWNRLAEDFRLGNVTVAPAYRGLTVGGQPDTRTASVSAGSGHNAADTVWLATKIGTARNLAMRNLAIPIATWREAHLIIAEVEGGQEAVNRINVLRQHHNLPQFQSADPQAIRQQVITERQRELFLEGHHLADMRRFNLPQIPAAGEPYRQGGVYGDARCFPLPAVERITNPNVN